MKKNNSILDLFLYFIGIILTIGLFLFSNSLSLPFIVEFNSGEGNLIQRMLDIIFSNEGSLKIGTSLVLPLILHTIGIGFLSFLMFKLGKYIISNEETIINRIIFGVFLLLAIFVLVKAFIDSWTLFILVMIFMFIAMFILILIGSLLSGSSDSRA